jgi:branched-chain amino acid transport system ATP-binding protein
MALFEAEGLHKRFGGQVVLENISLAFEEGQLSGIMGPNGAGKTTCFNVLTGRFRPDRGSVRFAGQDITGQSPRQIARKGVSRSFQIMNLFDEDSAIDNILIALPAVRARGWSMWRDLGRDAAAHDEAAAVLARVGLAGKERVPCKRLSYGERRALEIGLALAAKPRLLFLDEPTAGLGAEGTARLADLILELKRSMRAPEPGASRQAPEGDQGNLGTARRSLESIVIIEHDMRFLFGLADRISVIHWGQVIAEGSPEALRDNPWVQRSNLGVLKA